MTRHHGPATRTLKATPSVSHVRSQKLDDRDAFDGRWLIRIRWRHLSQRELVHDLVGRDEMWFGIQR
jgi:hypothetical protein